MLLGAALLLQGCSSDECTTCGPSEPTELVVQAAQERVQVTRETLLEAVDASAGRFEVSWYVDGVLGGSDSAGVVTQTNPTTYTAPFDVPAGGTVVVEARLADDDAVAAADTITVLFDTRYVDAEEGSDGRGDGRWTSPFKTITAALAVVAGGDTVHVFPGTYDETLGEIMPLDLPENVALRGAHRDSCIVDGPFEDEAINMFHESTISHLTVRNPDRCTIGIYSTAGGLISNVLVNDGFLYSAIRASGEGNTVVIQDCELVNTEDPEEGRGFELVFGTRAEVRRCVVRGWRTGMFINTTSEPLVEHCELTDNGYGVDTWEDDVETNPDFGEGERGSEGGNTIAGNTIADFVNRTPTWIFARQNFWDGGFEGATECIEILPGCDVVNTNGGVVEWCDCGPR
jgi:hypothetical protein